MEKISVKNIKNDKVKDIELNADVFGIVPNDPVLYDAITLYQNSLRQGTHDTKTRSEVSGGGRKPWRQKGTGRARQGSTRAPHWRHGGVIFGPHPRDYNKKMNRKERRLALRSALSYKFQDNEMIVIDNFKLETAKTKDALQVLNTLAPDKNILLVVEELDDHMICATRNLSNVILITVDEINTYDVISCNSMIITEAAVKKLEEVLA